MIDKELIPPNLQTLIRTFPTEREVSHCGTIFYASPLDHYSSCPSCGERLKLRSFSGATEVEDMFDAFAEWLIDTGASTVVEKRQREILDDTE